MPSSPRPGTGRGGGAAAPGAGGGGGARRGGADRQDDRVELGAQLLGGHVAADVDAAADLDALAAQLVQPPLDEPLLDLEVRHAEADQGARGLVALKEHAAVPGGAQLLGGRHAGGATADHRGAAAGL